MSAFRRSGAHPAAEQAAAEQAAADPTAAQSQPPAEAPPAAPAAAVPASGAGYRTGDGPGEGDGHAVWEARTRVFLTPIAGPSIIGLFGFMGATLMVGAWQAGWYGTPATPAIIFPFVIFFGGLMQAGAAFWALTAGRILPAIPPGAANDSMAMWFVVLCAITLMMALAASFSNFNIAGVLWTLAAGSGLTAAGMWGGYLDVTKAGGVLFVISAGIAWYAATAMVFQELFGRTILPIFRPSAAAVIPGRHPTAPIQYEQGMPGVRIGQ